MANIRNTITTASQNPSMTYPTDAESDFSLNSFFTARATTPSKFNGVN